MAMQCGGISRRGCRVLAIYEEWEAGGWTGGVRGRACEVQKWRGKEQRGQTGSTNALAEARAVTSINVPLASELTF